MDDNAEKRILGVLKGSLHTVNEKIQEVKLDINAIRNEFNRSVMEGGVKFTRIEVNLEASQSKLDALDRIVVRGNGEQSLRAKMDSLVREIEDLSEKIKEVEGTIKEMQKSYQALSPSKSDSSNKNNDVAASKLLEILSSPSVWIGIITALTALGGIIVASDNSGGRGNTPDVYNSAPEDSPAGEFEGGDNNQP